jgi:hypothetical protein
MDARLRRQIRERAGDRCEYCHVPSAADALPFQVDHIIAQVHHGSDAPDNTSWSCFDCNVYKGPNLAGVDSITGRVALLFHPRNDRWSDHFEWEGPFLIGKTPGGRATIDVLRINLPSRVEHRRVLIQLAELPIE